jgi:hypothetical protein
MSIAVTDVRGSAEHQIDVAAKAIGRSPQRRAVFREIHSGRRRVKSATEIAEAIGLPKKRVLEEAVKFVHRQIVTRAKRNGDTAYERDNFYYIHRAEIFKRADRLARGDAGHRVAQATASTQRQGSAKVSTPRRRQRAIRHYDTFLSHASEDKAAIASPLYKALTREGITVWYDQATLTLGDSLREKIDEGLSRCRFGIVILSPKFFSKQWPKRELDGLVARETTSGEKVILPIWHKLTKSQVSRFSPTLAGKLAVNSKEGIPSIVAAVQGALRAAPNRRGASR